MGKPTNRLRVWRAERRLTQLALAKKARMNVARVSYFENGHALPKADEKKALARALNADVADVFPESEAIAS